MNAPKKASQALLEAAKMCRDRAMIFGRVGSWHHRNINRESDEIAHELEIMAAREAEGESTPDLRAETFGETFGDGGGI